MASTLTPFLRGAVWTWRRRIPEFSTETRHWQLSLRTSERSIAYIIAGRLNHECDQMLDAISKNKLKPAQTKVWLTSIVRPDFDRIERQSLINEGASRADLSILDPMVTLLSRDELSEAGVHKMPAPPTTPFKIPAVSPARRLRRWAKKQRAH